MIRFAIWLFLLNIFLPAHGNPADAAPQEKQCMAHGWKRVTMQVEGIDRELLWQAPAKGRWSKGAILVLHGGGGQHFQWCVANARVVEPQVRFSESALAEGFAVFLLNSSDRITDLEGRLCGKVWDDEVRSRPNLDLPFIGGVMRELLPRLRPQGSRNEVFITGLSSGGYMTARAGTHFDDLVTAFAPVSSGDPYGWHRICEAGATQRSKVHGAGFDNETGKQITEREACRAESYPNERPWDSAGGGNKPAFRVFRHHEDGINDRSCSEKISRLLLRHGYRGQPDFVLHGGQRSLAHHLWLEAYTAPFWIFSAASSGRKKAQPLERGRLSGKDAHGLLTQAVQREYSPEKLAAAYRELVGDGQGPVEVDRRNTAFMDDWPDRHPQDIGWAYLPIDGSDFDDGLSIVVTEENGAARIREIEWGAP